MIYDLIFANSHVAIKMPDIRVWNKTTLIFQEYSQKTMPGHPILYVCKQIYGELIMSHNSKRDRLWQDPMFSIDSTAALTILRPPFELTRRIRNLSLEDNELEQFVFFAPELNAIRTSPPTVEFRRLPALQKLTVHWHLLMGHNMWAIECHPGTLIKLLYFQKPFEFNLTIVATEIGTHRPLFLGWVVDDKIDFCYTPGVAANAQWEKDILNQLCLRPRHRLVTDGNNGATEVPVYSYGWLLDQLVASSTRRDLRLGHPRQIHTLQMGDLETIKQRILIDQSRWKVFEAAWMAWFGIT